MGSRTGLFNRPFFYTILALFIVWFILFEFILPENNILPKLGIVLISIPALFEDYNFLIHFFTTISVIYLSGIIAYLVVFLSREFIFRESGIIRYFQLFVSDLSIFFSGIFVALLFIFWFPNSLFIEYIFSFLISFAWLLINFNRFGKVKNENYYLSLRSLGANNSFLDKHIYWNEFKPQIIKRIQSYHLDLWTLVLIFEFIQDDYGLGTLLRKTLNYRDFSALILLIIIISVLIIAGYKLIKLLENRYVFWEAE